MNAHDGRGSLVEALRLADPAASVSISEADALATVRAVRTVTPRARRWRLGAVLTITIAGAAVPAGALASNYVAHTGWFGSPNPESSNDEAVSSESDNSEWLDVTAPDFVDAAAALMPDYIVLPDAFDPDQFAQAIAADLKDGIVHGPDAELVAESGALMQTTGIVATFEHHAQCALRSEWIATFDRGDIEGADIIAAILRESATWPATVASDGGGIVDEELRLAAAAESRDRDTVATDGMYNCAPLPDGAAG